MYYGQITCQSTVRSTGSPCTNNAYWRVDTDNYLCGVHSKGLIRQKLPKDPHKADKLAEKIRKDREAADKTAADNRRNGKRGHVICSKLRMMKLPEDVPGYIKVFPNYKHQNRRDGIGCMSLSPKAMGPIVSPQPGLPPAISLENFHQGSKVFPSQATPSGDPNTAFFETQLTMFQSDVPLRHHPAAKSHLGKNKNVPLYWLWKCQDGSFKRFSYFECRQFYCNYYERIASKLPDYKKLQKMLQDGYNLQIIGYDAYDVRTSVDQCYLDTSRPFGHELVLYTMLTHLPAEYPWRKYKTEEF